LFVLELRLRRRRAGRIEDFVAFARRKPSVGTARISQQ